MFLLQYVSVRLLCVCICDFWLYLWTYFWEENLLKLKLVFDHNLYFLNSDNNNNNEKEKEENYTHTETHTVTSEYPLKWSKVMSQMCFCVWVLMTNKLNFLYLKKNFWSRLFIFTSPAFSIHQIESNRINTHTHPTPFVYTIFYFIFIIIEWSIIIRCICKYSCHTNINIIIIIGKEFHPIRFQSYHECHNWNEMTKNKQHKWKQIILFIIIIINLFLVCNSWILTSKTWLVLFSLLDPNPEKRKTFYLSSNVTIFD